jgi:hypothetical protein
MHNRLASTQYRYNPIDPLPTDWVVRQFVCNVENGYISDPGEGWHISLGTAKRGTAKREGGNHRGGPPQLSVGSSFGDLSDPAPSPY